MALNGGLDAKKASAAPCPGRGCQEESSDGTTSQRSSRHSRHMARRGLPSAVAGTATVSAVLGLKAPGSPGCQGQHHPTAQNFPLFLSLLGHFLKQKFS